MIYLDNAATTIPSKSALERANRFNEKDFFNPSALYEGGLKNKNEILQSKQYILSSIGGLDRELIFTSCGSESDNQAIFGVNCRKTYVTDLGEHSAVFNSFNELKLRGKNVEFIPLNKDGSVCEEKLLDYVALNKDSVGFVSIVHVNNETGAINDINGLSTKIKNINKDIIFHSDGVQAFGKLDYKLGKDIDLYSISAHKINALKGCGALIKKKNISIKPLIYGGGQENGFRSGTENVFGIKVFEYASIEHYEKIKENFNYVLNLKNTFTNLVDKNIFEVLSKENSSPYILSLSAKWLRGEVLMHSLEQKGIVIGNGSACSSKKPFSRVMEACGYKNDILYGVCRISFSPYNNLDDIIYSAKELNEIAVKLKGIMG